LVAYSADNGYRFALKSDMGITTVAEFKEWLDTNDVYVTAEYITPQTYTLPSVTMLSTLLGINNIWTDAGDTAVTYSADTKQFIIKKIAELNA